MKKLSNLLLAHFSTRLLAVLAMLTVCGSAWAKTVLATGLRDNTFYYRVYDDQTAEIIGLYSGVAAPVVPYSAEIATSGSYKGKYYKVTSIASDAFSSSSTYLVYGSSTQKCYNATLVAYPTKITGGDALENIGTNALGNLPNLTEVDLGGGESIYTKANLAPLKTRLVTLGFKGTLPESVCEGFPKLTTVKANSGSTAIGKAAFKNCTALKSFTSNYCPRTIGDEAFRGCTALTTFTINKEWGENLTSIGNYAFYGCSSLPTEEEGIIFSQFTGLETIGEYAFVSALKVHPDTKYAYIRAELKNSKLTSIGAHAFDGVDHLRDLTLPSTLKTIGEYAFRGCKYMDSDISGLTSLESIGQYAFSGCSAYSWKIDLSDSKLTSISESAFRGSALTSVKLPASVTTLGNYAFAENTSLTTFESPCTSLKIGNYAFYKTHLASFDFTHASTIGAYAFSRTSLTEVMWPTSFVSMNDGVFKGCHSLTSFDASASRLSNIGVSAFEDCYKLATVKLNPTYFKGAIGDRAFAGTLAINYGSTYYNTKMTITGYQNVSSIGSYAFANSPIDSFNWPSQISTLPVGVFAGSKQLSRVILPEGVENVATLATKDSAAFSYCGNLKRVEIPSTMKKLGSTFRGSHVDTLIVYSTACESTLQCWMEKEGSSGYETKGRAFVPYSAISTYRSPTGGGYLLRSFDVYGLAPESVTLDKTEVTIRRGKSATVAVKSVTPSNTSPIMSWTRSGNDCFDRTDGDGRLSTNSSSITMLGTAAGVCTLTAIAESYYLDQPRAQATFKLTVLDPDTVLFDQEEITLAIGNSRKLTASVMPLDECDQTISSWSSSNSTVCSVASDGTVTAKNSGTAIIRAYTPGNRTSGHYTVNVPALKNDIDKSTIVLKPGESAKLNASVYGNTVTWSSDNEAVATVDQEGNVRAVSEGVAYIMTSIPEDVNSHAKCMVIVTTEKVMYVGGIYYTTVDGNDTSVKVTNLAFGKEGYYGPTDDRDEYKATITVPAQITYDSQTYDVVEIGDYAFYRMQDLQQVVIPACVKRIGNHAFEGSKNLVRVSFDSGSVLETIGFNAFKGCSKLHYLTIPDGVNEIGTAAFMDCIALESLTFPSALETELSENICRGCTSLEDVTLSGVKVIGKAAFRDCKALTTITYSGTSLKMIDEEAFMDCSALAAVTLPSGVASIQNNAYEGCSALESFTFPATIEGIGALSFEGCKNLRSIEFKGSSAISFGENAFAGCSSMNKVTVTSLGAWAQSYFANLGANPLSQAGHLYQNGSEVKSFTMPNTVAFVGQYAFAGANSITSITLPSSVKAISDNIASSSTTVNKTEATLDLSSHNFANELTLNRSSVHLMMGNKLTLEADATGTVTWSSDNTSVATVSNGEVTAIAAGTAMISAKVSGKEGKCLVVVSAEKPVYVGAMYYTLTAEGNAVVTNLGQGDAMSYPMNMKRTEYSGILSIPATVTYKGQNYPVTEVGMQAFYSMEHLQKVIIPASVKMVGMKAFEDAENLARVEFAASSQCDNIAQRAFYGCAKLDEVVLPSALTMLNKELFRKCKGLKSITLPASLTTIGEYAFAECTELPGLTLTSKVASLQNYAFDGCTKLASMVAPASLEGIGALCFNDCTKLQSIEFKGTKPISIGESAFKGCSAMNKVTVANLAAWVQSYFATPWSNPTTMAHNLYVGTTKQTGVIAIPATASFVSQYAFSGCTDITGVTLPTETTAYSDGILRNCGGTTINKGQNLSTRDAATSLELDRNSVLAMPGEKFTIVANASSVTWESSNTMVANVSSEGEVTVVGLGTAVITAKASGKTGKCMVTASVTAPAYVGAFYYKLNSDDTASLTNMGNGAVAFGTERYDYAGIVSIPASVTYDGKTYAVSEVGSSAFYKMAHLQKTIVPASVTTIGSQAFESSEKMKLIEFASGSKLANIVTRAFYECKALNHVALPEGITTINESVFRYCEALTDITLPSKLTNINEYAFANCTALEQITLPQTLTAIQDFGFAFDKKLARLEFQEAMYGIGKKAFQDCTALANLHFKNVKDMSVGEDAFSGCTGLKMVDVDNLDAWVMTNFANEKANPLYYSKTIGQEGMEFTSIKVPSAKYINQFVFVNCQKLISVDLPASVETVSDYIFQGCTALESVVCRATSVPDFIGTRGKTQDAMKSVFEKATLYVPAAKIEKYQANDYWKLYHAIEALVESVPGDATGDGLVNDADVTAILNHILGKAAAANPEGADANGDHQVTVTDLVKVIKLK